MRRTLYLQMLYLIRTRGNRIAVENADSYRPCIVFKRDRAFMFASRVLRLKSVEPGNGCRTGTVWNIPEYELDRALAEYRGKNRDARERIRKGASYLDARDVNAIIEIATHGLVRPGLTDMPLSGQ